ncbi:MAG: SRPBCC family protein [Bacteroidales bacterium]|nr:SRPBCC family protein [Bacteroidales bacterium]
MTTYESEIKTIAQPQELVFNTLSDLSNLKKVQNIDLEGNQKAAQYFKDITFDSDSVSFSFAGIGQVGFRIIKREPFKTIKLQAENSPVGAYGWIQLLPISDNSCKMKITIKAKLPMMIKMMADSKLKKGINTIADAIVEAMNDLQTDLPNP